MRKNQKTPCDQLHLALFFFFFPTVISREDINPSMTLTFQGDLIHEDSKDKNHI